ncbi:MAG: T9SS type A sorting domain-containing protein [Crocinitomicaceae bacterium]|nr:T9SS type A sorting domain-containing protein [Crocinitomicaceae bacterium]
MKKILLISVGTFLGLTSFGQVINTFPYVEDFEGEGISTSCSGYVMLSTGWSNDAADSGNDWNGDIGGTGSGGTGPSVDYNPGTGTGHYMYTETSGCSSDTRNMLSPWFDLTGNTGAEVSFAYHMLGATMGTMALEYRVGINDPWTGLVAPFTDNVNLWQISTTDIAFLTSEDSVQFKVVGNTGTSFTSDMAIDNFTVNAGSFSGSIINVQDVVCFGQATGEMTATSQFGVAPISYAWSNGDTTATISGLTPGEYCCILTDANSNSVIVCDTIYDLAPSPLEVYAHTPSEWICTDSMGLLVIDSLTGGVPVGTQTCGISGLGCTGSVDTLSSNASFAGFNSSTGYPSPLGNWYWGARHQMAYTASELTAAGVQPGNISGIAFYIDPVAGLQGSTPNLDGWNIKLGCSPDSVMTAWDNSPVEVYPPTNITITTGWNWFEFPAPYFWDGTSTLIVETCLNNSSFTNNAAVGYETTSYTSCIYYRADASGVCGNNTITGTSSNRPVIRFTNCAANASYNYTYSWSNGASSDTSYAPVGTYTLTVEDAIGCVDSTVQITFNESAPVNIDDMTICETNPADYIATPGFDSYMWSTSETTSTISITTGGTYYVDAVDSLGCPTSDTAYVTAIPAPVLAASPSPETFGGDGAVYLSIYGDAYPFTVDWDNDGTGDNDDTENIFNLTAGDYTVVVTDTNGCYSTLTVTVTSVVGLEENSFEMAVYPNPVQEFVNIQLTEIDANTTFQVIDIKGQVVTAPIAVIDNIAKLDMSQVSDGIYFIRVTHNGTTREVKVVKQ